MHTTVVAFYRAVSEYCVMTLEHKPEEDCTTEGKRDAYHELDLIRTAIHPGEIHYAPAVLQAERQLNEIIDELQEKGEFYESEEDFNRILERVDAIIAISSSPRARELRQLLIDENK